MQALNQALRGIKVLDFSQGIAAPHAACLLAEMGAEVIKIEPPSGDWLRGMGIKRNGSSVLYGTFNRGKRGIALDLKQKEAFDVVKRLIGSADVMLESNRPGTMQRLGLDYETVRRIHPRIVYASVTGFGRTGPHAHHPATDTAVQAFSGISFAANDMVQPVRIRIAFVDVVTGVYLSNAIVAALVQRGRTGEGQHVDVSLLHAITAIQSYKFAEHQATGGTSARELFAAVGIYPCSDGFIALSAIRDQQVVDLMHLLGREDLLRDPKLSSAQTRFENQDALRAAIAQALATRPVAHWLPRLHAADLIAQQVQDYDTFRAHPQTCALGLFTETDLGEVGTLPVVRMPGLTESTQCAPAPRIGQNTLAVLREIGMDEKTCEALLACGAAVQAANV